MESPIVTHWPSRFPPTSGGGSLPSEGSVNRGDTLENPLAMFAHLSVTSAGVHPAGFGNANLGMQFLPEFLDTTGGCQLFAQPIGVLNGFCGASFGSSSHGRGYWAGIFWNTGVHAHGQIGSGTQIHRPAAGLGGLLPGLGAIHPNVGRTGGNLATHHAGDLGQYPG